VAVLRCRDAEGSGVGDSLAEQVDQRIVDAGVRHAPGREKKLHDATRFDGSDRWSIAPSSNEIRYWVIG
jgi:hypothetical protein